MTKLNMLYEGKAKQLYTTEDESKLIIHYKDDATAFNGVKKASPSEKKNLAIARKSIFAACDIRKGEVFTEKNITTKRPGKGISPMSWDAVLGRRALRNFKADELTEI